MQTLPILYYETSIICLDDNSLVTQTLERELSNHFKVVTFNDTNKFLESINLYNHKVNFNEILYPIKDIEYNNKVDIPLVGIDFGKMLELIDNPQRREQISVLIIDYLMPEKDGITICKEMSQANNFKKILLTGSKDYKAGLDAISAEIIDTFFEKKDLDKILDKVLKCSFAYFDHLTIAIKTHLETENRLPISDLYFNKFFLQFMRENEIIGYCLIDKYGSMYLINSMGEKSTLVVHTDKSLNEFTSNYSDLKGMQNIIKNINDREFIPWYGLGRDRFISLEDLKSHLYHPLIIDGEEKFYISHQKCVN